MSYGELPRRSIRSRSHSRHGRSVAAGLIAAGVVVVCMLTQATAASAASYENSVGLGTADPFSVLGGQSVTNTATSTVSGDVGVSPGTAFTGSGTMTIGGAPHITDAVAAQAQIDLTTAYNSAASRTPTGTALPAGLATVTFTPGVYNASSAVGITGDVTLDGQNDPNPVFIFQIGSSLTTAAATHIILTGHAQACNVFWQVASSATLGTASTFVGSILALTSISLGATVTVQGRALARNGSVTLIGDTFTSPACATTPTTTTVTASPTTATGTTVSATVTAPAGFASPTGTVIFTVNGVDSAPVALDSLGHATLTLPPGTPLGTATVTARFTGTGSLTPSASTAVPVPIAAVPTTVLASTGTAYTTQLIGSATAATLLGLLILIAARTRPARHRG